MEIRKAEIDTFFANYIEPVIQDLKAMLEIPNGLNFPLVMTTLALIEALGKCVRGKDAGDGLETFLFEYVGKTDHRYADYADVIKDVFRNELAHSGIPKRGAGASRNRSDLHLICKETPDGLAFIIDAETLFKDFIQAVKDYKRMLLIEDELYNNLIERRDYLKDRFPEKLRRELEGGNIQVCQSAAPLSNATYYPYQIEVRDNLWPE